MMECTQRLEYTQEFNESKSERICAEQIGFLGICGKTYPVKKGPNKIGRDPTTCSIVLNLNSVSRQHAVINVLNKNEFMLMDLDSANKTKLMDKILQPYIPHLLKNGDMVQFGDIFGVFRLLEEDNHLPMTQAIDIPETPISTKPVSKLNKIPVTTIPESPDISDRDDSFIAPSQPKGDKCFRRSNNLFLKPSSNVISIQPVGSNKIDNIYWSSSKKSVSLNSNLDESVGELSHSNISDKKISRPSNGSIHDMETQALGIEENVEANPSNNESIHNMETQNPFIKPTNHDNFKESSIYDMETQAPFPSGKKLDIEENTKCVSIHDMETQNLFLEPLNPDNFKESSIYDIEIQAPFLSGKKVDKEENTKCIHDIETQVPGTSNGDHLDIKESIYDLPTQVLRDDPNDSVNSIYTANTQIPGDSPSIHSLSTQLPVSVKDRLPEVCKIDDQHNMEFNLFTPKRGTLPIKNETKMVNNSKQIITKLNEESTITTSDDELMFDEMDSQNVEENFDSQPLLPPLDILQECTITDKVSPKQRSLKSLPNKSSKNKENIDSDSSTDCEDIALLPTQKITIEQDDDITDCEDLFDEIPKTSKEQKTNIANVGFEDMLTQVIHEDMCDEVVENDPDNKINKKNCDNIADMPTQVLKIEEKEIHLNKDSSQNHVNFEDLPTQIIDDDVIDVNPVGPEKTSTNIIDSPFKIPLISPLKVKRKDIKPLESKEKSIGNNMITVLDDDNYYASTQDIVNDLSSQRSLASKNTTSDVKDDDKMYNQLYDDDELIPCSVEDYKPGPRFPHLESPDKKICNRSYGSDGEGTVSKFVSKLSYDQIKDVIGVEPYDKVSIQSDASDIESTPKKLRPLKFMDIDLPDSQEIKTSVSLHSKILVTESSSDSEPENDSEEQCTPILFRNKKKKKVAKIDLTKKFDAETLPTRIITRVRKPTSKLQNDNNKKLSSNILKPKFFTEQEEDIDNEIIKENISRLKSKSEKQKNKEIDCKISKESVEEKENGNDIKKIGTNKTKSSNSATKSKSHIQENTKKSKPDQSSTEKIISKEPKKELPKNEKPKRETRRKKTEQLKKESKSLSPKQIEDCLNSNKDVNQSEIGTRNTRSTRTRRKVNPKDSTGLNEVTHERVTKPRTRKEVNKIMQVLDVDLTVDVVPDVRRSKRQRTSKEKREEKSVENMTIKSILKKSKDTNHEQSTVYNISSESGGDSPRNMKRPATYELDPPTSKRMRSTLSSSSRSTPVRMNQVQHVLFTAFPCEEVRVKLEKLGAVIVSDVMACSVVLTLQIKRTFKLLCALGLGKPIVGPDWVQACADSNMIVDPWLYVLKDETAEKRFQFSLYKVLRSKRNFLKGFNVSATPKVMPNATEMKLIVECSGGTWKEGGPQWVCVSCAADKALWPALKKKGALVVSTEFILGGVLRQRADITTNKL